MRLNEIAFDNARPVDGYGPGFFRIGGDVIDGPALVMPSGISSWGGYDDVQHLVDHAASYDVLFVGTGAEIAHVPPGFRKTLEDAGVGLDVMASPAACRTYNVLLSEGRRVALALIPV
jgi:uncharacterized protein